MVIHALCDTNVAPLMFLQSFSLNLLGPSAHVEISVIGLVFGIPFQKLCAQNFRAFLGQSFIVYDGQGICLKCFLVVRHTARLYV